MISKAFKDKIFPLSDPGNYPQYYSRDELSESDNEEDELLKNTLYKEISNVDNKLDHKLILKYFHEKSLLELFKYLRSSYKRIINDAKMTVIETNLIDLKKDIRSTSDDEVKSKNLDLIAYFFEKILVYTKEQQRQGLKILTPKQMINRLPALLAQLKAVNHS